MKLSEVSNRSIALLLAAFDQDAENGGFTSFPQAPEQVSEDFVAAYEHASREALIQDLSVHLDQEINEDSEVESFIPEIGEDPVNFLILANGPEVEI